MIKIKVKIKSLMCVIFSCKKGDKCAIFEIFFCRNLVEIWHFFLNILSKIINIEKTDSEILILEKSI